MISIFRLLRAGERVWAIVALAWLTWLFQLPPRPSAWTVILSGLPLGALLSWLWARRRGVPWRTFVTATADVHAVAAMLLYGLGVQFADGHGISTDGVIYFSQLRSAIFDGNLDLDREFQVLNQPPRPSQIVPIGPTIFWLPLYLIVALLDWAGRTAGAWPAPSDPTTMGLSIQYVRAALVSSYVVGAAGLLFLHAHLRREFGALRACATTVLTFGATTLFWYMAYEASMTHAASFGMVAIFIVLAARWVPGTAEAVPYAKETEAATDANGAEARATASSLTPRRMMILGAVLGLAFLTRPQEAVFALFPAWLMLTAPGERSTRLAAAWRLARWAFVGAVPALVLFVLHASVLLSQQRYAIVGEGGYLRPFDARWLDTLFSSWHGFLSWTPIAYVAVVGTIVYLWRNWRWASCALGLLLIMAWVNGSTTDWAAGWAFGGRRFTSLLVMLAPGLAVLIDVTLRRPALLLAPAVAAALLWNQLLMVQYTIGMLPKDQPIEFAQMVRQQADVHTRAPYLYPFAFPANFWFAWREGLPASRYDRLAAESNRTAVDLAFDRDIERYLLDGWDAPGADDFGPSWWIGGVPATFALPLDLPTDRPIRLEVMARTRADAPAVRGQLLLDVNGTTIGDLTASQDEPTTTTLTIPPIRGGKPWRRGFNTFAFRVTGVTRADPTDRSPAGPLAQQIGSRTWPIAIYRVKIEPQ